MGNIIIVLLCVAGWLLYEVFLGDELGKFRRSFHENRVERSRVAKIAQIKVVSTNYKEIEKFVSENAKYLSNKTVKKLVARIEAIHDDRVITDDALKVRINNLDKASIAQSIVEETSTRTARRL